MNDIENKLNSMERYLKFINKINEYRECEMKKLFELASSLKKVADEEKSKLPFQINVISSAARGRLKETAHSKILYDLLQNELVRKSFIKYFFKDFNIDVSVPMIVPAPDTDRIDAAIYSKKYDENQFFIIIENKVNDAQEQQGQIYRYFHIAKEQYGYRDDRIFVLYLNSTTREEPSLFSLTEEGKGENSIKDKLQDRLVCRSYKYDVKEWLEQELHNESELLKKEELLKSALQQYLNYLEIYFKTSKIFSAMNTKLENLIEKELHLNEKNNPLDKLNEINSVIKELSELVDEMGSVKLNCEKEIFQYWSDKYKEKHQSLELSIFSTELTLGFTFKYKGNEMLCCVTKDSGIIYWGVGFMDGQITMNTNKELFSEATEFFKNLIPKDMLGDVCSDNNWPVWKRTSYQNGFQRLCSLTDAIINVRKNTDSIKF